MAVPSVHARKILERILKGQTPSERAKALMPRPPEECPLPPRLSSMTALTAEALQGRRTLLRGQGIKLDQLSGQGPEIPLKELAGNIENFVGFARLPVGVIGPLRINGTSAHGDYYIPLATTEGALIASCHRGASTISLAGGASAICLTESVCRAPCFIFRNVGEAGCFCAFLLSSFDSLQKIVAETSRHCALIDMRPSFVGKDLYVLFDYTTGDASGQNMVTFATEAVCRRLVAGSPVRPQRWYLEGNISGDKKATMLAFMSARGKKVVAEAVIPRRLVRRFLHAEPRDLVRYWQVSLLGGIQSGSIGVQGHYANILTALFMACGQDVACVSEASVGMTLMEETDDGDLYASVSLPNLIVGTVGGGTGLPTARECLEMIRCAGEGRARAFAEICAATTLAGELSIIGALAAGDFGKAHLAYGRKRKR